MIFFFFFCGGKKKVIVFAVDRDHQRMCRKLFVQTSAGSSLARKLNPSPHTGFLELGTMGLHAQTEYEIEMNTSLTPQKKKKKEMNTSLELQSNIISTHNVALQLKRREC